MSFRPLFRAQPPNGQSKYTGANLQPVFARKFALHRERFGARLLGGRRCSEELQLVCLKIPLVGGGRGFSGRFVLFVFIN